jgi:hypothetical protein
MQKQGVLSFRYESEPTTSGMTALAGLPAYLELAIVSGLTDSIQRHLVRYKGARLDGYSDCDESGLTKYRRWRLSR